MSAAVTRTLKITYGSVVVGGTTDYLISGPIHMEKSYQRFAISCNVVIQNDTAATFQTACAALEAAYRIPRQLIKVEMESQTFIDLAPTSNTGFLAEPSCVKIGDERTDTGRSRMYALSITCQLPADLSGQSGRLDSTIDLTYDPERRRRISINGVYTALGSNSSSAQYESAIATYASATLSAFGGGGTFDLISESEMPDDANKNCRFSRNYQEVLYASTAAGLSHASIVNSVIVYAVSKPSPGDSPGKSVKRAQEIRATITCGVNNDVSTALETLYTGSIRPYLISETKRLFAASVIAIIQEDSAFDHSQNVLSATLVMSVIGSGASTLSYVRTVEIDDDLGELLQPAWSTSRYAKYRHDGIARRIRTTKAMERRLGIVATTASGFGESTDGGGSWVRVGNRYGATPSTVGAGSDQSYAVTDLLSVIVEEWVDKPKSGSGGGAVTTPGNAAGPFKNAGGTFGTGGVTTPSFSGPVAGSGNGVVIKNP